MAEKVGQIFYEVTLDTSTMVRGQREAQRELDRTSKAVEDFQSKLSKVAAAVQAYFAAGYVIAQADAYTKLVAQLRLATDGHRELAAAQSEVKRIAQEAQVDISGIGALYAKISTATKEMGVSQAQVGDIVRSVALALKVSGASSTESASATLQLAQAFASGVLRGDEFNSVAEAAPRLMRALADGIGVPIGALRQMAGDGKLTAEVLATALPKALKDLEGEAKTIQTVSGAVQNLKNEFLLFIGQQTEASGSAKMTADAISVIAANIDLLAAAAYGFAAAKLANVLIGVAMNAAKAAAVLLEQAAAQQTANASAVSAARAEIAKQEATIASLAATKQAILTAREQTVAELQLMQAFRARGLAMTQIGAATTELAVLGRQQASVTAQQAAATAALTAAQASLATATTAASAAGSLAARAIGFLGGPIGAVTTMLGLGVAAWNLWGTASREGETKALDSIEKTTPEIVEALDKQIAKLKERNALAKAGLPGIAKQESEAALRLAELQGQINNLIAGTGPNGEKMPEESRIGLLQTLLRQYAELAGKIQEVSGEQEKLAAAGTATKLAEWMAKYATSAEKAASEIAKAKKELGSGFTPELEQRIRQKYMPPPKPAKDNLANAGYLAQLEGEARILAEQDALTQKFYADEEKKKEKAAADDQRRAQDRARSQTQAQDIIAGGDPIARLELDLQRKSALLAEAALNDLENQKLYAQAQIALEQQTQDKITSILTQQQFDRLAAQAQLLGATANLFGGMAELAKQFGGEQSKTFRALFAISKGFALADAGLKLNMAILQAMADPTALTPAQKLANYAAIASAGTAVISSIAGMNFGGARQYGGPASAGNLYRVNETGQPEMFVGSGGRQYMMPTKDGRVVPADQVGGGGVAWTINIHNAPPGTTASVDESARTVDIAVARVVSQLAENSGPIAGALRNGWNVTPRNNG